MTSNLTVSAKLTLDPSQFKAGLVDGQRTLEARADKMRQALASANQKLGESKAHAAELTTELARQGSSLEQAQARAARMAESFSQVGPPTRAMARDMAAAEKAVVQAEAAVRKTEQALTSAQQATTRARDAVISKAAALREVKGLAEANQRAIAQAAEAEKKAIADTKAAADAAHRKRLADVQEEVRARMEVAAEAKALAASQAAAERAAADATHRKRLADVQEEIRARREAAADEAATTHAVRSTQARRLLADKAWQDKTATQAGPIVDDKSPGVVRGVIADVAHLYGAVIALRAAVSTPIDLAAGLGRITDEARGVEARVKLASNSVLEFDGNLAAIRATATDAGTQVSAMAALFYKTAKPIQDMGYGASATRSAIDMVSDSLRISGSNSSEATAGMTQFAQAMGSGVLRGDELNSILENIPRLAQAIADGLGVTVGELRGLGEQGALTSKAVFDALRTQQGQLEAEAARLPKTVGMAFTNAAESAKRYVVDTDKVVGASAALVKVLESVADNIGPVITGAAGIVLVLAANWLAGKLAARAAAAAMLEAGTAGALAGAEAGAGAALAAKRWDEVANAAARAKAAQAAAGNAGGGLGGAAAKAGAGRGLARVALGALGGPVGWALTGISVGIALWDQFGKRSQAAAEKATKGLGELAKEFEEFSSKMGPNEYTAALEKLRHEANLARDALKDPIFAQSDEGKKKAEDLKVAEVALDKVNQKVRDFNNGTKERGALGLDKLELSAGGLMDKDVSAKFKSFEALYRDFLRGATTDSNRLKMTTLELKTSLAALFADAKTPAEFNVLIGDIEKALGDRPKDSGLKSLLESSIEGRFNAERQALDAMVSGLQAKAQRTQALFSQAAQIALAQFSQAAALAAVAADLKGDTKGQSSLAVTGRSAEVAVAVQAAKLEVAALEQAATRKRELIAEEARDIKAQARDEIESANYVARQKIQLAESEARVGKLTAEQAADAKVKAERAALDQTTAAIGARGQAEANAARKGREVDGHAAQERAGIAEKLYKTIQGKANEALQAYQAYASQVIALDQKISNNRLNTSANIHQLKRQDMTPQEQAADIRRELDDLRRLTDDARRAGKNDHALDLLERQRAAANNLASATGDGIDPKAQRKEAITEIERVGQETDAILQSQRSAAASAAQQQLAQFKDLSGALNSLAQQIQQLNTQAQIALKPSIDQGALTAALDQVKTAFSNLVVPVKVVAQRDGAGPLPTDGAQGGNSSSVPGFALGGWTGPGGKYTPAGIVHAEEYVQPREVVRQPGALEFMERFRRLGMAALKGYANGGLVTAATRAIPSSSSIINRLQIPSMPKMQSAGSAAGLVPAVFDLGPLGRVPVQMPPAVRDDLASALAREALKRGNR